MVQESTAEVAGRLNTHEEICSLRYMSLVERMGRVEKVVYAVGAAICLAFLGLISALLIDRLHLQSPPDMGPPTIGVHPPTISR
jgi:hypothetical protein